MSDETDLIGYQRMKCPRCINEVLYREDSSFRPICSKCETKMKPSSEVMACTQDTESDRDGE